MSKEDLREIELRKLPTKELQSQYQLFKDYLEKNKKILDPRIIIHTRILMALSDKIINERGDKL